MSAPVSPSRDGPGRAPRPGRWSPPSATTESSCRSWLSACRTSSSGPGWGHRRTLAAVGVGLGSVPVLIAGTDQDGDSAERVVQQWAETEHRAALSTGERIGAVAQLAAFGLTAASIARRTKTPRAGVDAALTVARSQVAVQTADAHQLTLEEAAVVAEFDTDDGAVADLLRTAGSGRFAHTAQRLRDLRAEAADRAVMEDAAREAGLTVLPYTMNLPRPVTLLRSLLDGDGDELDPAVHTGCPGHAVMARRVWNPCTRCDASTGNDDDQDEAAPGGGEAEELDEDTSGWEMTAVCLDPSANDHHQRWSRALPQQAAEVDPETRREQRREVITGNREWRSATSVRRQWVAQFATRRTAPKGAAQWIAATLATGSHPVRRAMESQHRLAAELLGAPAARAAADASDARAVQVSLVLLLAAHEDALPADSWRRVNPDAARYLGFLASVG